MANLYTSICLHYCFAVHLRVEYLKIALQSCLKFPATVSIFYLHIYINSNHSNTLPFNVQCRNLYFMYKILYKN